MLKEYKGNVIAAVAGAVVGAGAVIAGAILLNNKGNQKKVGNLISKVKGVVNGYAQEAKEQHEEGKENIKNIAEKVIKAAKKEVKKL